MNWTWGSACYDVQDSLLLSRKSGHSRRVILVIWRFSRRSNVFSGRQVCYTPCQPMQPQIQGWTKAQWRHLFAPDCRSQDGRLKGRAGFRTLNWKPLHRNLTNQSRTEAASHPLPRLRQISSINVTVLSLCFSTWESHLKTRSGWDIGIDLRFYELFESNQPNQWPPM
ncbi:hypothetical protein K443DRAFT_457293 [Laccaria amethystina LaAM-08-1]|uniref:Uncharacterized protein n=1 Tax=Laccaria amethystina LaAM-08-1 TaxID=1095629 RepID=A0A0C9XG58_9AGAR|nr:hypothetical protein K443DRAFT_457293 [Laccaria amethystina LaAM-08-1]